MYNITETKKKLAVEYKDKGNKFFQSGDYGEAINCYKEAIKLDNSNIVFHSNLAQCYLNLNNFEKAKESSDRALAIDNNHLKSLLRRSVALENLQQYDEALKDALRVYQKEPSAKLKERIDHMEEKILMNTPQDLKVKRDKPVEEIVAKVENIKLNTSPILPESAPTTFYTFEYYYKMLKNDINALSQLYLMIEPDKLASIIQDSLSNDILASFFEVIINTVQNNLDISLEILKELPHIPRFKLQFMFLNSKQQEVLSKMWTALETKVDKETLKSIKSSYPT